MSSPTETDGNEIQRRPSWQRRLVRYVVLFGVVPYLSIVVVFAVAQRRFLYPREQVSSINVGDAYLLAGRLHDVVIETHDGLRLRGWLALADGFELQPNESLRDGLEGSRFVVLYCPGNSGNRLDRVHDCRDLTGMQCDVLLFDYRGYGDNPGSPTEEDLAADAWSAWN